MNILIAGYYGFGNVGDELILSSILMEIGKRYPSSRITVLSADPERTHRFHGVSSVRRWSPLAVVRAIWKADVLVVGGGGLLQDQTSSRSLAYYLGLVALARLLVCPVVFYALGVESVGWSFWRPVV